MAINSLLVIVTLLGRQGKENVSNLTNIITYPNEVTIDYPSENKTLLLTPEPTPLLPNEKMVFSDNQDCRRLFVMDIYSEYLSAA